MKIKVGFELGKIDMMQRIARLQKKSNEIHFRIDGSFVDVNISKILALPELKCPIRTEEGLSNEELIQRDREIRENLNNRNKLYR